MFSSDWKASDPFDVSSVSSMRWIADLSDLSKSVAANTTGQSGHPGNRHYDDMIDSWRSVRYHAVLWDTAALRSSRPEILRLVP